MRTLQIKFSNLGAVFLIFLTLVISSCSEVKNEKTDSNQVTDADIRVLKKNHIITLNKAVKQYDKYSKQRVGLLKDTLKKKYKDKKFSDTRTVWFDVETIRTYLAYIDKHAKDAEGFQFYFGVNSDKDSGDKKNHQTFFVAPTIKNVIDGKTIQSGFTVKNGKRVFIYEEIKKYLEGTSEQNVQKGGFLNLLQDDDDGYLLNEGEPNPPGPGN